MVEKLVASYLITRQLPVAVVIFVLSFASIAFTRETNSVATLWPANALLLAVLIRSARDLPVRATMLAFGSAALLLSNLAAGNGLALSAALAVANVAEVAIAFGVLLWLGYGAPDMSRPRDLGFFIAIGAMAAPLASASIGAAAVAVVISEPWQRIWLTWYAADALGMAIIGPLALSVGAKEWRRLHLERRATEAVVVVLLIIIVACLASYYRSFLFVIAPVVLLATFRFGVVGAASSTLLVALVASFFVIKGIGPLLLVQSAMAERIFILQIFLAVTVLWSLPVAAALAERDRFAAQLSRAKVRAEAASETKSHALEHVQKRLWQAEEDERSRLARELHDRTGQSLAVAILHLKQLEPFVAEGGHSSLRDHRAQLDDMGKTLHHIAWELRPSSIDELGLQRALAEYVSGWSEKFGVEAELQCGDTEIDTRPDAVRTTIFRVTQEALTNIAKHASGATAASVSINRLGAALRLTIEDNGCGFDTKAPGIRRGLGIAGMRERLGLVDGELDIESTVGVGTTLFASIPLPGEDAAS